MPAGWVNLIVLIAILLIVGSAATIFYVAATRHGGRKKPGLAKPSKAHYRQVNPKTGDMFR
jgi:flagellar basal body-associated protein FliL